MEIRGLIKRLKENKIDVSLSGNELEIHFDGDELPDELLNDLRNNKQGIIKFLKEVQGVAEEAIPALPVQENGYVLSSAQRRLWVLSQFEESSIAYNNADFYAMKGELNQDAMEQAFKSVLNRHEIMRTVYREDETGEIKQFVQPLEAVGFAMIRQDLREENNPEEKVNLLLRKLQATPFNLETGPVIRAGVYRLADKDWVLAFVVHHIVTDAWTTTLFKNELFLHYNLYSHGQPDPLPPLRIHYKDYAAWQQQQLTGEQLKAHKEFWLKEFDGELPVLDFPGDKPRPLFKTYNGDTIVHLIGAETSQKIRTLAQQNGASLFMGLVAALKILLYQYTGQTDIIVGFPIGGRDHPDLEDQLGLYINTIALRTQFKDTDTVRQVLDNVRQHTLGAYDHQIYPFDELLENLALEKDASRSALFDIMVVLQNITADTVFNSDAAQQNVQQEGDGKTAPSDEIAIDGHTGAENKLSKFDMTFEIREAGDQLFIRLEYNTDIYHEATIKRLGNHYSQVLDMMAAQPDSPIHQLQLLQDAEQKQILVDFNNTQRSYPADNTIVQLFEAQVALTPDKPAVFFEGSTLSYQMLNQQANQLAAYLLQRYAIQPNDKIGVLLHKSELLIIAILGILKTGAAYVPIDVELPPARKDFIMGDTGINILITLPPFAEAVPFFTGNMVTPMEVAEAMAGKEAINPSVALAPNHLAYIMYTSGTTGNPKGVMISHKSVVRLVKDTDYIQLTGKDTILSTGAVSFDATTFEYWGMLLNGGKLVMSSSEMLLDDAELANIIQQQQVSTIFLTTGWFNQLVERAPNVFEGMTTVLTGGERVSNGHMYLLRQKYPQLTLLHVYGPTENTTFSTAHRVENAANLIPIGRPIANSTAYIINGQGHLAPIGMQGEICVGGDGLAQGYLNQPELTAEKFVDNPLVPGQKMYRTGDLGRWLPNGDIVFMGRRDEQVKIRGYRIELGEIEAALRSFPDIADAVVTVRQRPDGDKEIIAYIVSATPLTDATTLAYYMAAQLPGYMVPAYYVPLPGLPLNTHGKVDKRKLPAPEGASMASGAEYVAPRTETEEKLVAIWTALLGRDNIGVKDNFFAIGGHSLKATRMASHIRREFEVTLNLAALFSNPTIEHIAAEIEKIFWANNQLFDIEDAENITI